MADANQLEQVRNSFVSLEAIQGLQEQLGDKLEKADFEAKRWVLEALEARVDVAIDGVLKVSFSVPTSTRDFVLANPALSRS